MYKRQKINTSEMNVVVKELQIETTKDLGYNNLKLV